MINYKFYNGDLSEIKSIWEDIFKDPECFTGFYFSELCQDNKIFVAVDDDVVVGMVHLNPYTAIYNGREEKVYYIVGVCVKEEYRFKGVMREMMNRVMDYMRGENMPFTFLMPKEEVYYSGLGFENIYNNIDIKFNSIVPDDKISGVSISDIADFSDDELAVFAKKTNKLLSDKYLFFSQRDILYVKNLIKEHKCQRGSVFEVCKADRFIGYFSYDIYEDEDGCSNNMFVERFCIEKNHIYDILKVLKSVAIDNNCKTLSVTVPYAQKEDLEWKNALVENERGNIKLFKGKGIMAYSFLGQEELDFMKNNSFFDEIV